MQCCAHNSHGIVLLGPRTVTKRTMLPGCHGVTGPRDHVVHPDPLCQSLSAVCGIRHWYGAPEVGIPGQWVLAMALLPLGRARCCL